MDELRRSIVHMVGRATVDGREELVRYTYWDGEMVMSPLPASPENGFVGVRNPSKPSANSGIHRPQFSVKQAAARSSLPEGWQIEEMPGEVIRVISPMGKSAFVATGMTDGNYDILHSLLLAMLAPASSVKVDVKQADE